MGHEFIDRQQLQFCQLHPNVPQTSAQENRSRDCLLLLHCLLSFPINILKVISNEVSPRAFSFRNRYRTDTRSLEVSTRILIEKSCLEKLKRRQKGISTWYKLLLPFTAGNPSHWLFGLVVEITLILFFLVENGKKKKKILLVVAFLEKGYFILPFPHSPSIFFCPYLFYLPSIKLV